MNDIQRYMLEFKLHMIHCCASSLALLKYCPEENSSICNIFIHDGQKIILKNKLCMIASFFCNKLHELGYPHLDKIEKDLSSLIDKKLNEKNIDDELTEKFINELFEDLGWIFLKHLRELSKDNK